MKKLATAFALSAAVTAHALPTSLDETSMIGFAKFNDSAYSVDYDADTVSFGEGPNAIVNDLTGYFATASDEIALADQATFFDFSYADPFQEAVLWEVNDYVFTMETLTFADESSTGLVLEGTGVLEDATESISGSWYFSSDAGFNWSATHSFLACDNSSDDESCQEVEASEAGILATLSLAFAGLFAARRNKKA